MPISITIGGVDFTPQYKTNSAQITSILQNKANTMSLEIVKRPSQDKPDEGNEIIVENGSERLFAGYITRVTPMEIGIGQLFTYQVEATDYTYVLNNHNAQQTYDSQTLKYIVENLISEYAPDYSLDTTNVDVGPTVGRIAFNHISLRKCFEKLSNYSGYEWWVGFDKKVYFKPKSYTSAPEQFTDSSSNHESMAIEMDATQIRNSIVVKGGKEETSGSFSQVIAGDGVAREWILREKPKTMVSIELDTGGGYVTKAFGVANIDEDTGNDFMFSFQEKFIRCTATTTTPSSTSKIRVTYKYEVPVIIKLNSASSINALKAIEGGDGIHAFTITDPAIKSKDEARRRALKELNEYANPLINATVITRTGLLSPSSRFQPGQELVINAPSHGISVDSSYLIQEVRTEFAEDGTDVECRYAVRFGGRLLNATSFLLSLANEEPAIDANEEVDRIEAIQETLAITETVERDAHLREVAESLAISETVSKSNVTPPFKYGPTGSNQGVYNASEYG